MHEVSPALHTAEVVHWIALVVMAVVYTLRIRWLLSFNLGKDKSAPGNPSQSNKQRGARYSLFNVAMPWSMESTRQPKGFIFYLSFAYIKSYPFYGHIQIFPRLLRLGEPLPEDLTGPPGFW